VHVEVDLPDPERRVPVGTTGEARLDLGKALPATAIPLGCAAVRGGKATVFVIEGDVARARTVAVLGEVAGTLFVDPSLASGTEVVLEGRALLTDGDRVTASVDPQGPTAPSSPLPTSGAPAKPMTSTPTEEHRP
jgi:hypothetical protein